MDFVTVVRESSFIQSCLKAWSTAEEDAFSEVESLLGMGSSNEGGDSDESTNG